MNLRLVGLGVFALAAVFATAADKPIKYTMKFQKDPPLATITIKLPDGEKGTRFTMPAWIPGDYFAWNFGGTVKSVKFTRYDEEVTMNRGRSVNEFYANESFDAVEYTVTPSRGNFSDNLLIQPNLIFVNGAGLLGWVDDTYNHPSELEAIAPDPKEFDISVGGKPVTNQVLKSDSLELIGDTPFFFSSSLLRNETTLHKVSHEFLGFGNTSGVNIDEFGAIGNKAAEQGFKMFGTFPYKKYTYWGHFGGFPAGLEHAEGCRLGLWSKNANDSASLIFHEYVHAFNVKHIRPKQLRPINALNIPTVSTLWWLEGGTDYLADVLRYRAGLISKKDLLREMSGTYNSMIRRGGQAYNSISLKESSEKVWQTRGSQGYGGVSYYTKGKVVSFLLDLAIRRGSDNAHRLDDVFISLYKETGLKNPGYDEGRIRELCVEFGGEELGPLYDFMVDSAGQLPWGDILLKAGFREQLTEIVDAETADAMGRIIRSSYPDPKED